MIDKLNNINMEIARIKGFLMKTEVKKLILRFLKILILILKKLMMKYKLVQN